MMANGLEARKRSVDEVLSDHGQEKMQREQTSDLTAKSKRARVENDDVEMNLNDQAEGSVPNGAVKSPSDANVDFPISTNQLPSVSDSQNAQTEMASLTIDDLSPQTEQTFNLHEGANFEHLDDASIIVADSFPAKAIITPNDPTQPSANDSISQVTHRRTKKPSRKNDEHEQSKTMRKDSSSAHGITAGRRSGMSRDQLKFSSAIIKQLKKHRDAGDFVAPVDIEKYKIYDYLKIIKTPMDLGTVEQKLNDCEYDSVDAFVSDVRLIFTNCYTYNGRESAVSNLAHNLEMAFEKSLKQMPQSHEATSLPVPTLLPTPSKATETSLSKTEPASKIDTLQPKKLKTVKVGSVPPPQPPAPPAPPIVRRTSEDGRPKREIHPPPSKDYPETPSTKRNPKKNDMQLKFCVQALKELKKSKYTHIAWPFMTPVDPVKLSIPNYPKIIKHPMDISTIERKLNNADYNNADEFESDIRLMFKNCYTFNEPASDVYIMGKALEKVFDEKWAEKPAPPEPEPETREVDASDEDDPRDQQIAELERHLAMVSQQLASMKSHKDGKRKKDKDAKRVSKSTKPSKGQTSAKTPKTSSKVPRAARPSEKKKRLAKNKLNADGDDGDLPQFTFDQKRELSELINTLNGEQLSAVVQIIQTTVPNLNGGGEEEIELDIDSLDLKTLHKLHQFVRKAAPKKKKPPPKKPRVQHSEDEHERKILELEIQLQKFEKAESEGGQGIEHDVRMNDDGDSSSSDSSSSSGSDSEDSDSESDADGPARKLSSVGSVSPVGLLQSSPRHRISSSSSIKRSRSGSPLVSASSIIPLQQSHHQVPQSNKTATSSTGATVTLPTLGVGNALGGISKLTGLGLTRSASTQSGLLNKSSVLQGSLKRNSGPVGISTNVGLGSGVGVRSGDAETEKKGEIKISNLKHWAAIADKGNVEPSIHPMKAGSNPTSPLQEGVDQKVDPSWLHFWDEHKKKSETAQQLQAEAERKAQEEARRLREEHEAAEQKRKAQEAEIQRRREEARRKREQDYTESIDIHAQSIMMANFEKEMHRDRELARRHNEERARQARALAMNSLGKSSLPFPLSMNGSNGPASLDASFPSRVANGHVAKGNESEREEEAEVGKNVKPVQEGEKKEQ